MRDIGPYAKTLLKAGNTLEAEASQGAVRQPLLG